MDEEQPQKKITLNNFFEQIVEVNKVANAALTNSNNLRSQLNAVQLDLKRLVESLQVNFDSGVQNVQTQINEVTNVIVDDQRINQSETDALERQIFAQEDQLQKQVKGQKVKSTSSDGNLIQRTVSSIQNKAKSNLLATGLFGASFLLAGAKPKSDKNNFFNNFFRKKKKKEEKPVSKTNNDKKLKTGETVKKIEKKITPTNITNNIVNNNVVKEIIEEEKPNLVASTNNVPDDFDAEEHFKTIKFTVENNEEGDLALEKGPLKFFNSFDPENYKNTIEELVSEHGEDKRDEITSGIMQQVEYRKRELTREPDYHPLFKPPGGYKAPPTMEEVNRAYELGVSLDSFKDGGTTIIEGGTEVVNENMDSGQKRGEVVTDVPIVKSSNSPVSAVAIAEGNSLSNLAI
ncbi:MAG: hypothetical protein VXY47_08530 [Bacteroidota bacterium]|nr:hypothetical protein [Bacteroidota bacterium]